MPYRVTFVSGLFRGEKDRARSNAAVAILLEALTQIDEDYLRHNPETPDLYTLRDGVYVPTGGVRYHVEPAGMEEWTDIPTTRCRGWGDCEDLSCWLAAQYRVRLGIRANPHFTWRKIAPRTTLYHIQVKLPDGQIVDPSRILGMGDGKDR